MSCTAGSVVKAGGREGGAPADSTEGLPVLRTHEGRLVPNIDARYDSLAFLAFCYQESNKGRSSYKQRDITLSLSP